MRPQQLVDELLDLVEPQLRGRVRIEHRRVVHRLAAPGRAADTVSPCTLTFVDQRGEVARERAHRVGLDPLLAGDARHLHAAFPGEVVDQLPAGAGSGRLPLKRERLPPVSQALMMSAPYSSLGAASIVAPFCKPARSAKPIVDLALAPPRILVERDREPLDQVGPPRLDEPRHVFGEVLGGLGDEVAESAQDLEPDPVLRRGRGRSRPARGGGGRDPRRRA